MSDPTTIQQQQIGFAPEIAPYAQDLLGRAQALTDFTKYPYQQYQGERFAQFTPLQQQAFTGAQAMQTAPQLADASALAGTVGLRGLGYSGYQPGAFQNFYQMPGQYTPTAFAAPGMGGESFRETSSRQGYMSPYMQDVVDIEKREAQRQADIAGTARGQRYARAGAFGGARQAIENAEAQRNLATQMGDIQSRGLQSAFQQAQQHFNQEQAQRMAAQQAAEQSRQFGFGQQMAGAGMGAQFGQAAAQLGEQSRQFGAGLGLQGLQTALQGAGQLGQLGQTQFGQELAANQLQAQYGQMQQQKMQDILSQQYQDFVNYQNFPYKQLGFMSDIIRGVPLMQTGSAIYQAPPTAAQTLTSLGLGAAGLSKLFAKGGHVKGEKGAGLGALALSTI